MLPTSDTCLYEARAGRGGRHSDGDREEYRDKGIQREKNRVSARRETSTDVLLQPPHIPSSTTHKLNNTQTTVVGHVQELEHSADDLEVVREEKRLKSFDQQHLGGDMGLYTPPCVCWVNASVSIDTRCEVTKTRIFHSLPPTDDPA